MIKAAFFDIDGTLVSLKKKVYPPSTPIAIAALRKKGIKCYVATGRSKFEIAEEHLLDGIDFDGYLTNNGQDAYDPEGNLLYGKPLEASEAEAILDWVEKTNCACWIVSSSQSRVNFYNERLLEAMEAIHTKPPKIGDLRQMLSAPIYKIVLFLTREEMAEPMRLAPTSRTVQWFPLGHDIISQDGGKDNAMCDIIAAHGICREECIAFGDSENDLQMLEAAGIGVAMGNGSEEAKKIADYVTDDCDDDGILNALKHFEII